MELKDFIQKTLEDVAVGIEDATNGEHGHMFQLTRAKGSDSSYIDFDVAVNVSDKSGAGAGILVAVIGIGASQESQVDTASRIKFKVVYRGKRLETNDKV